MFFSCALLEDTPVLESENPKNKSAVSAASLDYVHFQAVIKSAASADSLRGGHASRRLDDGPSFSQLLGALAPKKSEVKGKPGGNPEPGDRLRFVFVFVSCVACVRAGEAKLRVRARCRVFLLTLASAVEVLLLFAASLRSSGRGVYVSFKAKWIQICTPGRSLQVFSVGFMKVLHQMRVCGIGFTANPLKTNVWCISCRKNLIKTRV